MKLGITFIVGVAIGGCAPHMTDDDAKSARDLAAEQLICVDQSTTLSASHECRCEAMKKHGRTCPTGWDLP